MGKQGVIIFILIILLIGAASYIGYIKYQEKRTIEGYAILQEGAQQGYEQAVVQLFNLATTCQPVPITAYNKTLNVIAVECLQVPKQAGQLEEETLPTG